LLSALLTKRKGAKDGAVLQYFRRHIQEPERMEHVFGIVVFGLYEGFFFFDPQLRCTR
jgi:hypothetical protein